MSDELRIAKLSEKDHKKAIEFAITGMHFDIYLDSHLMTKLYGRYFWYLEVTRATDIIALYDGSQLAGVLLARIKGKDRAYHSFGKTLFVRFFNMMQKMFSKSGAGVYETANRDMYDAFIKDGEPDGEIVFLAKNPDKKEAESERFC